jgi:GLPGLI family protein
MKRIILSFALLFSATGIFAQASNSANTGKITEGTIIYTVEWKLPEQMQAMASSFPKELTVYFKGDSSSLKTESAMYSSTNILNVSKEYERLLLDIPMMGKKFSVLFSPADQEKMQANLPELALKAGTETKNISGYNVLKHEVNEKKSNQNSEAWFTKDIEVTPNALSRFFDKNLGFPVEFVSYMNGLSVKAVVKEIKAGTVPAGSFSASKDFEEISMDQLMQMQGGR